MYRGDISEKLDVISDLTSAQNKTSFLVLLVFYLGENGKNCWKVLRSGEKRVLFSLSKFMIHKTIDHDRKFQFEMDARPH